MPSLPRFFLMGTLAFLFLIVPFFSVNAQATFPGDDGPAGLVPCGDVTDANGKDFIAECQLCHLENLSRDLIRLAVYVAVFAATLLIAFAGFKMVMAQGDTSALTAAKDILMKAVLGLLFVLAAWLIVDTLMKIFWTGGAKWNDFGACVPQPKGKIPNSVPGGGVTAVTPRPTGGDIDPSGTQVFTHNEALEQLRGVGINVTSTAGAAGVKENCPTMNGCTSLTGLRTDTLNQALTIKQTCPGCTVTIVGATEPHSPGQFSHQNGYKLDIQGNASVDEFFRTRLIRAGERTGQFGGDRYLDVCGNEYVRESTHWDVTVNKSTCRI